MSAKSVLEYFQRRGASLAVGELQESNATAALAAAAWRCPPRQIAKKLLFPVHDQPMSIVSAGDAKVDSQKFRKLWREKAKTTPPADIEWWAGYPPPPPSACLEGDSGWLLEGDSGWLLEGDSGWLLEGDSGWLDVRLQHFEKVFPHAGNPPRAVATTFPRREAACGYRHWSNVGCGWKSP